MKIGQRDFQIGKATYIVGILNVTPDSFSDGGKYNNVELAVSHAKEMVEQGADILDIGGESTRPGHSKISDEEEIQRVAPVLEKLKNNFDIPISLDSYKSKVVSAVLPYINMVNDIWGLRYDSQIAQILAKSGLPCCLMHNREAADYTNFWSDLIADLKCSLQIAQDAGILEENIILDGGVGFQKSYEQNLCVLHKTESLCRLGFPVMVAASRKSVIGLTIDRPVQERMCGTLVTTVIGVLKGASFVRVHDVAENLDAIKMAKSIMEEQKWTI